MFLIAGVQPRTTRLDDNPRVCPRCGSTQAVTQRIDHYFSVFFIPLIKVKSGIPFVYCPRCQDHSAPWTDAPKEPPRRSAPAAAGSVGQCPACTRMIDPGFCYCPYCGQRLRAE